MLSMLVRDWESEEKLCVVSWINVFLLSRHQTNNINTNLECIAFMVDLMYLRSFPHGIDPFVGQWGG